MKYTKTLATAEKEKKDRYFQPYLECRRCFTPMVYYADIIPGTGAVFSKLSLSLVLSNKLNWEY